MKPLVSPGFHGFLERPFAVRGWVASRTQRRYAPGKQQEKENNMKPLKLVATLICVSALLSTSSFVRAGAQEKEQKKPCCEATVEAGKKCKHDCCKKAAEEGKVCEKCHP